MKKPETRGWRLAALPLPYYAAGMKSLTVRLPEALVAQIAAESRARKLSRSDVVRERLTRAPRPRRRAEPLEAIADLIGSIDGLPVTLSARTKAHLRATG
jgi:Arc/MetJ-type ribon-helix-helix transcriptional regulator